MRQNNKANSHSATPHAIRRAVAVMSCRHRAAWQEIVQAREAATGNARGRRCTDNASSCWNV